jgi:hypothetical protein
MYSDICYLFTWPCKKVITVWTYESSRFLPRVDHTDFRCTHIQVRYVFHSKQNFHLTDVTTSPKTIFCRVIWLCLLCVIVWSRNVICLNVFLFTYVYIPISSDNHKTPDLRTGHEFGTPGSIRFFFSFQIICRFSIELHSPYVKKLFMPSHEKIKETP